MPQLRITLRKGGPAPKYSEVFKSKSLENMKEGD